MPFRRDWWCRPGDRLVMTFDLTEYSDPDEPFDWTGATAEGTFNRGDPAWPVWDGVDSNPDPPTIALLTAGRLTVTLDPAHTLPEARRIVFYSVRVTRTSDESIITNVAGRILVDAEGIAP